MDKYNNELKVTLADLAQQEYICNNKRNHYVIICIVHHTNIIFKDSKLYRVFQKDLNKFNCC